MSEIKFRIPPPEEVFNRHQELEPQVIDLTQELSHFATFVEQYYHEIDKDCGLLTKQPNRNKYITEITDAADYIKEEVAQNELNLTPENAPSEYRLVEIYQGIDAVCIAANALKLHNDARAQLGKKASLSEITEQRQFKNPERFILEAEKISEAKAILSKWQMSLAKFILDNKNNPDTVNFTEKIWNRLLLVERARHGEKERYAVASLKGGVRSLVATTSAITAIGEYSCYLPKASQDLQGIDLFVIRKNHQAQDGVVAVQIGSSQNTEFHLEPIYVKDIVNERVYLDDQNRKNRQKQNELREASERHSQEWRFGVNSVYIDLQGAGPRNIIVNPQTGLPRDPESFSEHISESQLPKVLQQAFADMDKGGSR